MANSDNKIAIVGAGHLSGMIEVLKEPVEDPDGLIRELEKKPKSKRGRYLPASVRARMTPSQKAASNRKKRKAGGVGSRAKYSKKVRKAVRRAK